MALKNREAWYFDYEFITENGLAYAKPAAISDKQHYFFCIHSMRQVIQETQQGLQTSAVAMHLVVARLQSLSVIFCLLPTSNACCDFKQQRRIRYSSCSLMLKFEHF